MVQADRRAGNPGLNVVVAILAVIGVIFVAGWVASVLFGVVFWLIKMALFAAVVGFGVWAVLRVTGVGRSR